MGGFTRSYWQILAEIIENVNQGGISMHTGTHNCCSCGCHRFHVVCFGLALGIVWGISMFIMGISAMYSGWAIEVVRVTGTAYIGYQPTWLGSFIGALWGFVDAFIGGVIFAALYNAFVRCCKRHKQPTSTTPPTFSQP
jgi:hypothetical protein